MVKRRNVFPLIILRELKHSPGRFAAIFSIVFLGAGFFAGMRATCPDMNQTCDQYLDAHTCEDISITAPIGLSEADIARIAALPLVERVEGCYQVDAIMTKLDSHRKGTGGQVSAKVPQESPSANLLAGDATTVALIALSDQPSSSDIDAPRLVEGRLPRRAGECLAETGVGGQRPASIGERLKFRSAYAEAEFTVTGIAQSPLFLSFERGTNSMGSGTTEAYYMILKSDARALALPAVAWPAGFKAGILYSSARIRVKGAAPLDSFSPAYRHLVENAEEEIRKLAAASIGTDRFWMIADRNDNQGIRGFSSDAERVGNLGRVFPAVFFLVAALVSLTAMTRLIEEKRSEIGTLKALGYTSREILNQYYLYAAAATCGGACLGMALGFSVLPRLIYSMYRLMYDVGPLHTSFSWTLAAESLLIALACTCGATAAAGKHELASVPAILMRPRAPRPGKRILLEKWTAFWRRLGFLQKVTARNLFRYKRRFWMTVAGIAGCEALLLTGFGMNDSLAALTGLQFGDIYHYDGMISFLADDLERAHGLLKAVVSCPDVKSAGLLSMQGCSISRYSGPRPVPGGRPVPDGPAASSASTVSSNLEKEIQGFLIVPEKAADIGRFISLHDGPHALNLVEGAVLTRKASILLNVKAGDYIQLNLSGRKLKIRVAAVTDQYVMHFIYLSPEEYRTLTGFPPVFNQIAFLERGPSSSGPDSRHEIQEGSRAERRKSQKLYEDRIGRTLLSLPGVVRVSFTSSAVRLWEDTMDNMRSIIAVIIMAAGLLTLVVTYTLTSINITERSKELATLKVLGFREDEVAQYIYRENAVLAAIGTVLGLAAGIMLHRVVVLTTEVDVCMFGRTIAPLSYLWAFAICVVFSIAANALMYGRLRRINMVEAMKSVE